MGHRVHGKFKRQGKLPTVLLAALLAAVVAVAMIGRPADAEVSNASIEAETMGYSSSFGEVVTDGAASGGKAVALYRNGSLSGQFDGNHNRIVVRARGDRCNGGPRMEVKVDGVRVLSQEVRSTSWADYPASITPKSGQHTLTVAFTNDYANRSCDRNLRVDKASLSGATASDGTGTTTPTQPPLFSDNFDRETDAFVPSWSNSNACAADRLTTDAGVTRKGSHSLKLRVLDSDVSPCTYTENPRAQVEKTGLFADGSERWVGHSTFFPSDFPTIGSSHWFIFSSYGFRSPYNGSAPGKFRVKSGTSDVIEYARDERYNHDALWESKIIKGQWTDLAVHIKFSTSESAGFVEIYKNGAKQTLKDGSTRKYYATLKPSQTGSGSWNLSQYRSKGAVSSATIYHDEVKVGTSYEAVAP